VFVDLVCGRVRARHELFTKNIRLWLSIIEGLKFDKDIKNDIFSKDMIIVDVRYT
jgi:hypothetical protein